MTSFMEAMERTNDRIRALETLYSALLDVLEYEHCIDNMRHNRRVSKEWVKLEELVDDFREKFE